MRFRKATGKRTIIKPATAAAIVVALCGAPPIAASQPGAGAPAPGCATILKRQVVPAGPAWTVFSDGAEENLVLTAIVLHGDQFGCGYAPALPGSVEIGQPLPIPEGGAAVRLLYTAPSNGGPRCRPTDDGSIWSPQPTAVCLLGASRCGVTCTR